MGPALSWHAEMQTSSFIEEAVVQPMMSPKAL